MQNYSYDMTLVCGARPDLLDKTLESFSKKVFCNFNFNKIIANVDPFGGDEQEQEEVGGVLKKYFSNALVLNQEKACFTSAVKRLWSHTSSSIIFHLEDDWEFLEDIHPEDIEGSITSTNKSIVLCHKGNFFGAKEEFRFVTKRVKIGPFKIYKKNFPIFSTSPCFLEGDFARTCANHLDTRFDPEKQFYSGVNKNLEGYVGAYTNKNMLGERGPYVIKDIGRLWRAQKGIKKITEDARSQWSYS